VVSGSITQHFPFRRSWTFGDFSTIGFTLVGLGEPREVRAGVVGGSYFEVMGLYPVLGRLVAQPDGLNAKVSFRRIGFRVIFYHPQMHRSQLG
jgi:hypothetical protein